MWPQALHRSRVNAPRLLLEQITVVTQPGLELLLPQKGQSIPRGSKKRSVPGERSAS